MDRRGFLQRLMIGASVLAADLEQILERLLWTPGKKRTLIPRHPLATVDPRLTEISTQYAITGWVRDLTDNRWHHVVGTRSGATPKLYVDGVLHHSVRRSSFWDRTPALEHLSAVEQMRNKIIGYVTPQQLLWNHPEVINRVKYIRRPALG
jgi:hypothetical protein